MRVDGQRGHSRGLARGQGGTDSICVLSKPSRGDQGARVPCARREGVPSGGQLRRSQPRVSQGGGGERAGVREHHPTTLLRGGRQDDGFRDRRATRLEGSRPHRLGNRRRDALLTLAQGTDRVGDSGLGTDELDEDAYRPAARGARRSRMRSSPESRRSSRASRRRSLILWRSGLLETVTW